MADDLKLEVDPELARIYARLGADQGSRGAALCMAALYSSGKGRPLWPAARRGAQEYLAAPLVRLSQCTLPAHDMFSGFLTLKLSG